MKFIKSFYFNKNKKYQFSEIWINWWLSILIVALLIWIIFLGLVIKNSQNLDSKLNYVDGKANREINIKKIGNVILLFLAFIAIFWGLLSLGYAKISNINKRKKNEFINKIKDILDKKSLKGLSDDEVKKIFIALQLYNMFAKKKSINSFTRENMELRIKR